MTESWKPAKPKFKFKFKFSNSLYRSMAWMRILIPSSNIITKRACASDSEWHRLHHSPGVSSMPWAVASGSPGQLKSVSLFTQMYTHPLLTVQFALANLSLASMLTRYPDLCGPFMCIHVLAGMNN